MSAGTNTIVSGPSKLTGQTLAGMTVEEVREDFADILNIPAGATASINGYAVDGEQVIVNGEEIVFAKPLGEKGLV